MKFSHQMTYDAAAGGRGPMLADPAFRREGLRRDARARRRAVTVDGAGAGMRVVVDQTQPADGIPSFAKKFVGDEIQIVQRETWQSTHRRASLDRGDPRQARRLRGTITLAADGDGHPVETVAGDVKVQIPMRRRQARGPDRRPARAGAQAEERVGRAWLAGDR